MLPIIHLLCTLSVSDSARILGYVPSPFNSHQVGFHALWKELSLRGHQVVVITTHPIKNASLTNLTEIDLSHTLQVPTSINTLTTIEASHNNAIIGIRNFYDQMVDVLDTQLNSPLARKLIEDHNTTFDLVIGEYLYSIPFAFAIKFGCPSIGVLPLDGMVSNYQQVGNPTHPVLYPDILTSFGEKMSLIDRIKAVGFWFLSQYYVIAASQRMEQDLVTKHFGNDYPSPYELAKCISMLFVHTDPIFHDIKPLVPSIVQVGGGMWRVSSPPLPNDLKNILDSKEFIYFSLGSIMKSDFLTPDVLEIFLNAFSELPYTVIWKLEKHLSSKPANVFTSEWFPQISILKHPNIKLFIMQGGKQSLEEAIFSLVPMIGIPFVGDQRYNVKNMVKRGFGIEVSLQNLNKEQLKNDIKEVIKNPKYKNNLKKLVELIKDQPMDGLEKAVWWTEYVIRHKGAKHFRSPLLDVPWYQYLLLDVIGILLLTLTILICAVYFVCLLVIQKWRRFVGKKKKD